MLQSRVLPHTQHVTVRILGQSEAAPPWRHPRGKYMVSFVNSHSNSTPGGGNCGIWIEDLPLGCLQGGWAPLPTGCGRNSRGGQRGRRRWGASGPQRSRAPGAWAATPACSAHPLGGELRYRGTPLIRNTPLLGPYRRTIPRVLWWSWGGRGAVSCERGTPVKE